MIYPRMTQMIYPQMTQMNADEIKVVYYIQLLILNRWHNTFSIWQQSNKIICDNLRHLRIYK